MRLLTALAAAAVLAMPASAVTLFSQNFDTVTAVNNATNIPGFTVTGSVDVLRNSTSGVICAGAAGRCLDLVGSPNSGAVTSTTIEFRAGNLITVSFDVSGNQRLTGTDNFNFALNFTNPETIANFTQISGFQGSYGSAGPGQTSLGIYNETIARARPFVTYALSFVPTSSGSLRLVFGSTGANDARGPVLDNVAVNSTVVPEPATWGMLLTGFAFVGVAARRRRLAKSA
jgi:hypothetical protein